jgi:hypothetical protein
MASAGNVAKVARRAVTIPKRRSMEHLGRETSRDAQLSYQAAYAGLGVARSHPHTEVNRITTA